MGTLILFLLLGAVFFYIFRSYNRYENYSKEALKNFSVSYEAIKESDLGLFIALSAKVAKADGRVDTLEAELIKLMLDDVSSVFPQPQQTREILKRIFNEEKETLDNVDILAQKLAHSLRNNPQQQLQFMGFLMQLAFVDGECSKSEEDILIRIAEALQFDPKAYHALFDQFEKMSQRRTHSTATSLEDAYKILGVSPDADMQTVKKAYRKLVKQYHPDIIKAQGKDENYMQEATQKTQEINEAYELIKKHKAS